ncbi:hypothetical protein LCGC14_1193740 [marine sediment metagenome]|uniref:Uncharacterized protein n=1 Tax=marine sediment metagenome TaxID=412755 RepID=A0A0F9PNZ3_9ZZZZ
MTTPAPKSPEITRLLEGFSGRTTAIEADRCVDEPIGCGKPVGDFKDILSSREYRLSGLCQTCQDSLFCSKEI